MESNRILYIKRKITPINYVDVNYGYLYNWYAATDIREIHNTGWHVPTKTDFQTLIAYLGGATGAGTKLKVGGETGFNARLGGQRVEGTGLFQGLTTQEFVTSSTALYATVRTVLNIYSNNANVILSDGNNHKIQGLGVRLLKDSTTLTHGQTGTYVGNDGKVYHTICIGTQEWLADNLCETEYNNGDPIVEVTDNATWAALTTGARCSYNNLESNAINP